MAKRQIRLGVLLAMVVASHAAFPQPASTPPADDLFSGVAEQIEEIQSSQGVNAPDLIGPLTNLGLIFREQGDPALAAAAIERARHLVRVNYGLSSFEEAPLLRQLIQIEEGKGNAAAAWDLEQKLLALIRRHPGPRAAPMLREIADKRVDVLTRYSAGEFPPQVVLGCYYGEQEPDGAKSCRSGSRNRVKAALQNEARSYYLGTIEMVVLSEGRFAAELPELYLALVRAVYAAFPNDIHNTQHEGRQILRILRALSVNKPEPLPVQINARVQLADWDLLFAGGRDKNEAALKAYETLYDQLKQEGLGQPSIDELFSPSVPVVLPAFLPNPLVSTPGGSGHIDVAFDITKYGEGKAIDVLDTTTNTTAVVRIRLADLIRDSRFRPRVADGAFEDASRVVVRYYVKD